MGEKTPYEVWNGRKPHLGHLKVFGCMSHMKITTPHLKKLDDRSKQVVYFGVEEGSKAHSLYDPLKNKITVSRDVIFEEKVQWKWSGDESSLRDFQIEDDPVVVCETLGVHSGAGIFPAHTETATTSIAASGETAGSIHSENSVQGSGTLSEPGTQVGVLDAEHSGGEMPEASGVSEEVGSEEGPQRFRDLADIYANTEPVELMYYTDGEALLAEAEEPTCFSEAAGDPH